MKECDFDPLLGRVIAEYIFPLSPFVVHVER